MSETCSHVLKSARDAPTCTMMAWVSKLLDTFCTQPQDLSFYNSMVIY